MALAIFDIDGTLVRGPSTEKRLVAMLLLRGWLKPRQLYAFLRFGITHAAEYRRHTIKKNKAYLAGLRCTDVEALVADWVSHSAPSWWFSPCVARLREHLAAGDTVLLLSGTPQFLADALARELGVPRAIGACCATEAGRFMPYPLVMHPFEAGKLAQIRALCAEYGTSPAEVYAYADSVYDLPLLRFAGHPVAVRPDAGLRAAAVAANWEILGRR